MFEIQTVLLHFSDVESKRKKRSTEKKQRKILVSKRNHSELYSRKSESNCFERWKTNHGDKSISSNLGNFADISTNFGTSERRFNKKSFDGPRRKRFFRRFELFLRFQVLSDKRFSTMLEILNEKLMTEQSVNNNGFLGGKLRRIFTIRVRSKRKPSNSKNFAFVLRLLERHRWTSRQFTRWRHFDYRRCWM